MTTKHLATLALTGLLLLCSAPVWAAAAYDTFAQATCRASGTPCPTIGGVSTLTYPVTVGAGINRQMGVFAFVGCNSGDTAPTATATYNGTTLTQILSNTANASRKGYLFAWPPLSEPASGTHDVVITLSALLSTCTAGGTKSIQSGVIVASGVDQTTTFRSSGSNTGTGTSATLSIATSNADDLGIQAFCAGTTIGTTTETSRWSSSFTSNSCGGSGGATAAGSDVDFSWTMTGSDSWILIGAAFRGAASTSPAAPATVSWNVNPATDLQGYNLRRCVGTACVPTVLYATVQAPTRSFIETTLFLNTIYGYSVNAFDVTGNQSAYSATVYFDTGATPPSAAPTIASSTVDATGANLTWTGPPTTIRVTTNFTSVVEPLSNFPAGRYTFTWAPGSTQVCFSARDAAGIDNITPPQPLCNSLVGVAPALDTTPPVRSNPSPSATMPFGTTSAVMSVTTNEAATCRYSDTDIVFSAMELSMNSLSLTSSVTLLGLTDGSSTIYYVRCEDVAGNVNTSSTAITVAVGAAPPADATPPSTVASLVATAISESQASLTWGAATDNVAVAGYIVYGCAGTGCSPTSVVAAPVAATSIVLALSAATYHAFVVRAIDTSGNLSVADSNLSGVTTQTGFDLTPPSTMTNLRLIAAFTLSALLGWDAGTDTQSTVTTIMEQCTGAGCNSFVVTKSQIAGQFLLQFLAPSTTYRFRGKHSDAAGNVSVVYSNILDVTTPAGGLEQPRADAVQDFVAPLSVTRDTATERETRN